MTAERAQAYRFFCVHAPRTALPAMHHRYGTHSKGLRKPSEALPAARRLSLSRPKMPPAVGLAALVPATGVVTGCPSTCDTTEAPFSHAAVHKQKEGVSAMGPLLRLPRPALVSSPVHARAKHVIYPGTAHIPWLARSPPPVPSAWLTVMVTGKLSA